MFQTKKVVGFKGKHKSTIDFGWHRQG